MLVEDGVLVERDGRLQALTDVRVDPRARDRPGRARRAARPARAARALGAAACGRDRPGVLVGRRRRPDAARGGAGGRRRPPGSRPQGAHPPRPAHVRGRGRLRLRPHPRPRRSVRLDAEEPSCRPARALRRLGRGEGGSAAGAGRDPRAPSRAGARLPGRARAGRPRRVCARSASGRAAGTGRPQGSRPRRRARCGEPPRPGGGSAAGRCRAARRPRRGVLQDRRLRARGGC